MVKLNQFATFSWQRICSCQSVVGLITFLSSRRSRRSRAIFVGCDPIDESICVMTGVNQSQSEPQPESAGRWRTVKYTEGERGQKRERSFGRFKRMKPLQTREIDIHTTSPSFFVDIKFSIFWHQTSQSSFKCPSLTHPLSLERREERKKAVDRLEKEWVKLQ